jgi:4-alpha-glucanotransferase
MRSRIARRSGVLLHPSSFPSPWGIGDLGPQAYAFVDFLGDSHQQLWQVLPLGPTGEDGSPYSSFSSSAGNPLLISVEMLAADGFTSAVPPPAAHESSGVDQHKVRASKLPALQHCWQEFQTKSRLRDEFESFCAGRADWLDDYAMFMALKETYPGNAWNQWPDELVRRKPAALERARRDLQDVVRFHQFSQFAFYRQWSRLRDYAHERGIRIVGDIPFYMAFDSADVWANPQDFALDPKTYEPRLMAGVPPDYFSETGQLWGNPVYDWKHLEQQGFAWWVRRFQRLTESVDIVRIDHFRGFQSFWQVPRGETTAVNGEWAECPGDAFFHTLEHELGHLPVWAEDLGLVTPEVEKLRDDFDFPGMKVLQFAFDDKGPENPYLPFNFSQNCVCYTGTHDNDTTVGWWTNLDATGKRRVLDYVGGTDGREIHWSMIRLAMSSIAESAVVPLQDVLGLGSDARMNIPGKGLGNWAWRYSAKALSDGLKAELETVTAAYGRSRRFVTKHSGQSTAKDASFAARGVLQEE